MWAAAAAEASAELRAAAGAGAGEACFPQDTRPAREATEAEEPLGGPALAGAAASEVRGVEVLLFLGVRDLGVKDMGPAVEEVEVRGEALGVSDLGVAVEAVEVRGEAALLGGVKVVGGTFTDEGPRCLRLGGWRPSRSRISGW
mmetsp:Transcript_41400/g.118402  ORF Transcript_41400/g.118402 Transcript_41400/m.118402 type:complete len:144 (-) Transcript_41400:1096-1527(-)